MTSSCIWYKKKELTLSLFNYFRKHKIYYHFLLLINIVITHPVGMFLHTIEDMLVPHGQYHGCWWPGDVRCYGITVHGIDLVIMEYSGCSTQRVKNEDQFWGTVSETFLSNIACHVTTILTQWLHESWSTLVRTKSCLMFSAKPLPQTILRNCPLGLQEFESTFNLFLHWRIYVCKDHLKNGGFFGQAPMC